MDPTSGPDPMITGELATEIYENAYQKNPSEAVAQGVFLSYAKEHRYSDQRNVGFWWVARIQEGTLMGEAA